MKQLNASQVQSALRFPELIAALKQAFCSDITVPMRHHHDMENPSASRETTLLLMPAWQAGEKAGVKMVTVAPDNSALNLPSIQGIYLLLDLRTGTPEIMMDAPTLTTNRTAAASALAASFLARKDASHLFVVGTGALSSQLIRAHHAVSPLTHVTVWGRNEDKAAQVLTQVADLNLIAATTTSIEAGINQADIISVATLSQTALIEGKWLKPGQHLDLVGAYRPDMREADDEVMRRATIFVDSRPGATKETGDIKIPLAEGVITLDDIKADLFQLSAGEHQGRTDDQQITVFKSVGHALEDLAAAKLVAQYYEDQV
ncbi:MAG: ornithine cyclodeaminase family protein [Gammaproteobacteria bacterium]|nr:ornithine cyclodeaminase family protein [Gammaproteobacteria bacterium]